MLWQQKSVNSGFLLWYYVASVHYTSLGLFQHSALEGYEGDVFSHWGGLAQKKVREDLLTSQHKYLSRWSCEGSNH